MAKAERTKYPYPFTTKKQIAERIASDNGYVLECFDYLQGNQIPEEREKGVTVVDNKAGWMSSHASAAKKLDEKRAEGGLTDEDFETVRGMVDRYTKQLAKWERAKAIKANPELAKTAAIFSADVPV